MKKNGRRTLTISEIRLLGETPTVRAFVREFVDDFVARTTEEIERDRRFFDANGRPVREGPTLAFIGSFVGLLSTRVDLDDDQRDGLLATLMGRTLKDFRRSLERVDDWLESAQRHAAGGNPAAAAASDRVVATLDKLDNPIAAALRAEPRCERCGWNQPECRCRVYERVFSAHDGSNQNVGASAESETDQRPNESDAPTELE